MLSFYTHTLALSTEFLTYFHPFFFFAGSKWQLCVIKNTWIEISAEILFFISSLYSLIRMHNNNDNKQRIQRFQINIVGQYGYVNVRMWYNETDFFFADFIVSHIFLIHNKEIFSTYSPISKFCWCVHQTYGAEKMPFMSKCKG